MLDGSIERGYGGRSIFFDKGHVREDLAPVAEYARLLASVGINGCNLNNVNNAVGFSDAGDAARALPAIADTMRPYGVRVGLSVDIASPQKIGGLNTFDPLDPAVKKWWATKVNEIYSAHSRLRRIHGESRQRRPARARQLWPHAGRRRQHACRRPRAPQRHRPLPRLRLQPSRSTGRIPRQTARAPPTTSSIRSTASSQPTSSSRPRKAPSTSRLASRSRRSSADLRRPARPWNSRSRRSTWASNATWFTSRRCGSRSSTLTCASAARTRR